MKWVHQVLSRASGIIEKFISENSEQNAEGSFFTPPRSGTSKGRKSVAKSKSLSKAVIVIYTVGSVVIVCPSADMSNVVPLLHIQSCSVLEHIDKHIADCIIIIIIIIIII